jgi:nitroreductase
MTATSSAVSDSDTELPSNVPASTQSHALEVFQQYTKAEEGTITKRSDLYSILCSLDVEATEEEAGVLFRYLDTDGDGRIDFEDFLPWYMGAAEAAFNVAESFQSLLIGRRTIDAFDSTPVSKDVVYRAVQCAIAAPNRSCSEPWRFIDVGPKTVQAFAALNERLATKRQLDEAASPAGVVVDWTQVPGWTVVTTKINPDNVEAEQEDFKSVCCAIQNFMLSMWSEGVGTKWTAGHVQHTQEFADLSGVDTSTERVVGCVWYGYAAGGTKYADPRRRKKTVKDVLSSLP